jgi:ComF family protein
VLSRLSNAAVRVFLAPDCIACGVLLERPLQGPVCAACWLDVQPIKPPWCERCGDMLPSWVTIPPFRCGRCRARGPILTLARSAGVYDGCLRRIIHVFKYQRCRALAAPLAKLMRRVGEESLARADAVVPVPLSFRRNFSRGFNQSDDLARHLGLPVWRVLRRVRHGPPQAGLPASDRQANVRGAYGLQPLPVVIHRNHHPLLVNSRALIRGRSLLLVDDVMTTGETMEGCGRVLMEWGAREVCGLTIARAVAVLRPRGPSGPHLSIARR